MKDKDLNYFWTNIMKINALKKLKNRSNITIYCSLEKIATKISRKGIVFYVLNLSDRSGNIEVILNSKHCTKNLNKLVTRVKLNVKPLRSRKLLSYSVVEDI